MTTPAPTPDRTRSHRSRDAAAGIGGELPVLAELLGLPLHPRLEALLRRVQAAERVATGHHRRPTFRLMREILGASVRLGVPTGQLAECLGTTRGAIRARASTPDGTLTPEMLERLTGLTPRRLDRLSGGALSRDGQPAERTHYCTSDVVRAILRTRR